MLGLSNNLVTRDTDRLLREGERTNRKAINGEETDLVLFFAIHLGIWRLLL